LFCSPVSSALLAQLEYCDVKRFVDIYGKIKTINKTKAFFSKTNLVQNHVQYAQFISNLCFRVLCSSSLKRLLSNLIMATVLISESEKVYVLHGVQEDVRVDGRGRKDVRPIVFETGLVRKFGIL